MSRFLSGGAISVLIGVGCAVICLAADLPKDGSRPTGRPAEEETAGAQGPALRRHAWETDEDYEIRCRLSRRLSRVEMREVEFEEALRRLGVLCGVNTAPDWTALGAAGISKDEEVTVEATNVCGDDLLCRILEAVGAGETELEFEISRGFVEVSTKEDFSRRTVTYTYECADLLYADDEELARYIDRMVQALARYGNVSLSRDPRAMERLIRAAIREGREMMRADLEQAIVATVDPESWREAGGNVGWHATPLTILRLVDEICQ